MTSLKYGYDMNSLFIDEGGRAGGIRECSTAEMVLRRQYLPNRYNCTARHDLPEFEPQGEDFHIVTGLRCVSSGKTSYLHARLGNGGNCDTCENDAVIDMSGRWKRYGKRWFAPVAERAEIKKHQAAWHQQDTFWLTNTTRE
jgi:hypothetical protein